MAPVELKVGLASTALPPKHPWMTSKNWQKRFGRCGDRTRDLARMVRSALPLSEASTMCARAGKGGEGWEMLVRLTDRQTDRQTEGRTLRFAYEQ